jgi:hypothetical protein
MTAIVVAPLVALCCLGPLFIGSAVGGVVGWLSGQGLALIAVLAFLAAAIGYAVMRWRRASSIEWTPARLAHAMYLRRGRTSSLMSLSLRTNGGPANRNNPGGPQRTVAIAQAGRSSIELVRPIQEMPHATGRSAT